MAWVFNPFTAKLDFAGSGGGGGSQYLDGEVQFYADLPIAVGTPAIDSAFLVREGSGTWLINRKPAGIYIRLGNTGALTDWTYAGAFPDVFSDANFTIYNASDATKEVKVDASSVSANTTRTLGLPNASGTIALLNNSSEGNITTSDVSGLGTAATASVNELTTNTITLSSSNHNPAAGGQNYYIAVAFDLAPVTNPTVREFQVPVSSLITAISVSVHVGGTLGDSAGSASVALYNKNTATAQTLLNTGIVFSSSANSTSISGLSVPMSASTPYVIEITTPTFSTTPTTVRYAVTLYFQKQ
jgi:hypothetical protein